MNGLKGNPSAASSVVAGSATSSSVEAVGLLLRQPLNGIPCLPALVFRVSLPL